MMQLTCLFYKVFIGMDDFWEGPIVIVGDSTKFDISLAPTDAASEFIVPVFYSFNLLVGGGFLSTLTCCFMKGCYEF